MILKSKPTESEQKIKCEQNDRDPQENEMISRDNQLEVGMSNQNVCICKEQNPIKENSKVQNFQQDDSRCWGKQEIRLLFTEYDLIGPQWKIISQKMLKRRPNTIKNRFYTTLRNTVKALFRKCKGKCPKFGEEISSRQLIRLYDARQHYENIQKILPKILREVNYDIQSPEMERIIEKYQDQILQIYRIMYRKQRKFLKGFQNNLRIQKTQAQESQKKNCKNLTSSPNASSSINLQSVQIQNQRYFIYMPGENSFSFQPFYLYYL